MVRLRVEVPRFPVGARVRWVGPNGRRVWDSGRIKKRSGNYVFVTYDEFPGDGDVTTHVVYFWEYHVLEGLPLATVSRLESEWV